MAHWENKNRWEDVEDRRMSYESMVWFVLKVFCNKKM